MRIFHSYPVYLQAYFVWDFLISCLLYLIYKLIICFPQKNRVNDYIRNGLHKKLVDPDGGANLGKKRLEFGLSEELHPLMNENFPPTGECGTVNLPRLYLATTFGST